VISASPTSLKVRTFQAQPPVIAFSVADHQFLGHPLGDVVACALFGEPRQPAEEQINLC
jgi:hypothetical protein